MRLRNQVSVTVMTRNSPEAAAQSLTDTCAKLSEFLTTTWRRPSNRHPRSALECGHKGRLSLVLTKYAYQRVETTSGRAGTSSKVLARHFLSVDLEADSGEDDSSLGDLIVEIHNSRRPLTYTDGLLEYRLEMVPAQLVHLASVGIQGLRKLVDTTYGVLPSESEETARLMMKKKLENENVRHVHFQDSTFQVESTALR